MPRSPAFDREEKVEEAMDLFWEQGYEATSVQDLVDHLGLNRSSLYNTFGGKHELFLEALDRYRRRDREDLRRRLRDAPTAMAGIRRAFEAVAERAVESPCGCFTANVAVECAPHDSCAQERACEAFRAMRRLFQEAVERAQKEEAVPSSRDAAALGRFLTNAYNGIHLTAKTNPSREVVRNIVDETLRGIQVPADETPEPR